MAPVLPTDILKLVVCPRCKGDLLTDEHRKNLNCRKCSLSYPVRDGIPVMLIEEAKPLVA